MNYTHRGGGIMGSLFRPINRKPSTFSNSGAVDAVNKNAKISFEIVGGVGLYGFQLDFLDTKNNFLSRTGVLWLKDIKHCLDKQVDVLYSRTARGAANPITFTANHSFMTMSQDKIDNGGTYIMKIHQFYKGQSETLSVTTSTVTGRKYYAIYNVKVPALDADGKIILEQEKDDNGNLVFLPDGKPKMVIKLVDEPHYIYIKADDKTPNLREKLLYRNDDGTVYYFDKDDSYYGAWGLGLGNTTNGTHCIRSLEFTEFGYNGLPNQEKANYTYIGTFGKIPSGTFFEGYSATIDRSGEAFITRTAPTLTISIAGGNNQPMRPVIGLPTQKQ